MKELEKILKSRKALVFIDLEGTQISHEMIEIGAYVALIDNNQRITKVLDPFKSYIKAKHRIGYVVTRLTGITERQLLEEGRPFPEVMADFKKYVGKYWHNCLFVTFGGHDMRIVSQSFALNPAASKDDCNNITRHNLDFAEIMTHYALDENGNQMSLGKYINLFELEFEGTAHDAVADAYNLLRLYKAMYERKDIVKREYEKVLARLHKIPGPIQRVIQKIEETGSASIEDYKAFIEEELE
ncbi:MAG: exonuclease domain-containing protein [Bacilli bacterium]|nr:exonuclease domain-containing protein [Bacilli bacterium]